MKQRAPELEISRARRRMLQRMAAASAAGLSGLLQQVLAAQSQAAAQGIREVRGGTVLVDGKPAVVGTLVAPGATVITQDGAEAAYVVGQDAFLQRPGSQVVIGSGAASALRVVSGALLGVFRPGTRKAVATRVVTAGIRGTGCYVVAEERRTYLCLCYGTVDLTPTGGRPRTYSTRHHDTPMWIDEGGNVTRAEMSNHEDAELVLLESLVGRRVPFTTPYTR